MSQVLQSDGKAPVKTWPLEYTVQNYLVKRST
jgi:hypothetical protein